MKNAPKKRASTAKYKRRHEVIVIKSRGGQILEVKIVPPEQKRGDVRLETDNFVHGSMQIKRVPPRFTAIVDLLISSNKLEEFEGLLKFVLQ